MIIERTSEDQWLAARREYVTATDVARLASGGPATWETVRAEKRGETTFTGNIYTDWGREREPVLASYAYVGWDIQPNDALHVLDGTRWAATPDGVGDRLIGEYKTTAKPWTGLSDIPTRYLDQVAWAQMVCGAEATLLVWEEHENFQPLPIKSIIIERDEARIDRLIEVATRFLEERDEPDEFSTLAARAVELQREVAALTGELDEVKDEIRALAAGRDVSRAYVFGSLSLTTPKPRASFQPAEFKKAHPDLYAEFTREVPADKQTLRITPREG